MANRLSHENNRNPESFDRLLRRSKLEAISIQLTQKRIDDASNMVWELYRDKVLTSFQTNEILLAMGFITVRDHRDGSLVMFR